MKGKNTHWMRLKPFKIPIFQIVPNGIGDSQIPPLSPGYNSDAVKTGQSSRGAAI